VQDRTKVTMMD